GGSAWLRSLWRRSGSAERDPDRLQLGVLIEGLEAVVAAAEARLLEAAERRRDVSLAVAVDADRPRPETAGEAGRGIAVVGEDRGGETVGRVVRDPQRLLLVVEADDRDDRSEDLLAGDGHLRGDGVEDRRLDEPAAALGQHPLTPEHDLGAVR